MVSTLMSPVNQYPRELCEEMSRCVEKFVTKAGTVLHDTNLTADATLTARHLRHHGRKPAPPLVAEYWLIADETTSKNFPHTKPFSKIPPTMEKGGEVILNVNGNLQHQCLELEQQFSTMLDTVVRATGGFDKVTKWYGVWSFSKPDPDGTNNKMH